MAVARPRRTSGRLAAALAAPPSAPTGGPVPRPSRCRQLHAMQLRSSSPQSAQRHRRAGWPGRGFRVESHGGDLSQRAPLCAACARVVDAQPGAGALHALLSIKARPPFPGPRPQTSSSRACRTRTPATGRFGRRSRPRLTLRRRAVSPVAGLTPAPSTVSCLGRPGGGAISGPPATRATGWSVSRARFPSRALPDCARSLLQGPIKRPEKPIHAADRMPSATSPVEGVRGLAEPCGSTGGCRRPGAVRRTHARHLSGAAPTGHRGRYGLTPRDAATRSNPAGCRAPEASS
jgi:hypothetical protein